MVETDQTNITRVQHSSILLLHSRECVALVAQQPVHVANEAQILLVLGRLADGGAPFFNQLEDTVLDARGSDGWALWETADQLVQELLGADLEMERVAAVLDADVQQLVAYQYAVLSDARRDNIQIGRVVTRLGCGG